MYWNDLWWQKYGNWGTTQWKVRSPQPDELKKFWQSRRILKRSFKCRSKSGSCRKALRMSETKLLDRRQLPQLAQPFSRLLPLSLHRLLPLATPNRTSLRVHRADHGVSHLHHASSVEKRGTSPPNAQPSSASSASPHQLGCWKGHLRPRWPKLGVGSVRPSPAS